LSTLLLIVRRVLFLLVVIWSASTIVFFIPRLSSRSAIRERFAELARTGGFAPGDLDKIVKSLEHQFGLDLPLGGSYSIGAIPNWSWSFALDVAEHQILPALALIFGSVGGWVLSMRGMGVTIQGEDYVNFAEHKGLTGGRIFRDYYLRNALLPQVTAFALALGTVVTSAIVVEGIFYLPGIGSALNEAIRANDFPVIYGIVIFITIAVATLMAIMEFVYPLLDPRIRNQ